MKIIINTSLMVPIYEQIVDQIKMLIRNGELKENDNLPSVRTLSKELKISALTVKKLTTIWKVRVYGYSTWKRHLCSGYKYRTAFGRTEKELEADLEQAIQKADDVVLVMKI